MDKLSRPRLSRRQILAFSALTAGSAAALAAGRGIALGSTEASTKAGPAVPAAGVHPRVLVTADHIAAIKARLTDPVVVPRYVAIQQAAALPTDGKLPGGVYDLNVKCAIEANAFRYLVDGDRTVGLLAVSQLRNFLATFVPLDPHTAKIGDVRNTGATLFVAGLVYDWCYPLLTGSDRTAVIAAMKNLAAHQEIGFPPTELGSITTHASEFELQRDQLAAGIAVYDEDTEIFDRASQRIRSEFVPARNFFYPSGRYHQGDSYQGPRFAPDMFATVLYERMGSTAGYVSEQQDVMTDWIYQRRPDGQLMRSGDTYQSTYAAPGKYWGDYPTLVSLLISTAHYRNGRHQDYLLSHLEHGYVPRREEHLFFCLFYDPSLPRQAAATLGLTRFTGLPLAGMIARTGWDDGYAADTAIAQVNIGGYQFNNHSHLDAGAFQIYYRGALALDSGMYEGQLGSYGSRHDINYHKRTVAHNALLIHDPAETFTWHGQAVSNDGGQAFPADAVEPRVLEDLLNPANHHRNATSVRTWSGPDRDRPTFSHIKGDITAAYGAKARLCTRSFVFVNLGETGRPAALIVRDCVTTANPAHRTSFLLHSAEQPRVDGTRVDVARTEGGYTGRLRMTTVWPAKPVITTIGGPGHEFEAGGVNYPNTVPANSSTDPGAWRVEVSPPGRGRVTNFLHVLQPHAAGPHRVGTTHAGGAILVRVGHTLTAFSDRPRPLSRTLDFEVTSENGEPTAFLATDLARGRWVLAARRKTGTSRVAGQIHDGTVLYAQLPPGSYRLSQQ